MDGEQDDRSETSKIQQISAGLRCFQKGNVRGNSDRDKVEWGSSIARYGTAIRDRCDRQDEWRSRCRWKTLRERGNVAFFVARREGR